MTPEELGDLIAHLSANPEDGNIIQGTGGFRKLRWARQGKGKSGGVRCIHFYVIGGDGVYLTAIYGKGKKDNLSQAEKN